jgi:hypothetical protein
MKREEEVIWLMPIDDIDYVREKLWMAQSAESGPTHSDKEDSGVELLGLGRGSVIVGYTTLPTDTAHDDFGLFTRRIFTLQPHDRHLDPNGIYATGYPTEAVDPKLVSPVRQGWRQAHAAGNPVQPWLASS